MTLDRVARHYRGLEKLVFGRQLQAARCAFVRQVGRPSRVLLVGEGDGRFLEQLLCAHPGLPVECLDASAKMLALARARTGKSGVHFLRADIREAAFPPRRYDLLVTHFFLDCFDGEALGEVVEKLSDAATAEAQWLVADFHEPARGWRRRRARLLIGAMYLFFRLVAGLKARQLVDYAPLLRSQGFVLAEEKISPNELIRSQRWERMAPPK